MTWIDCIPYEESEGKLRKLYDRVKGPDNNVDNIMLAHSLRPGSLLGHMTLYKNVLHHSGNAMPKWFLEALGLYVSLLNKCAYCVEHHYKGMERLLGDVAEAQKVRAALEMELPEKAFSGDRLALMGYAYRLTREPHALQQQDIQALRDAGLDDGRILEANQVIAYFGYANRTVLGLGVHTDGDIIGLSPNNSDDPDDWNHQ